MIRYLACTAVLVASSFVATSSARAQQYVAPTTSGSKVVHNRLAPVIMHRVLPPFRGQHVYGGRYR